MLSYAQIKGDRKVFLALTGLTHKEFKYLLPAFKQAYEQSYARGKTLAGTPRQRRIGAGRKGALQAWEQKLLFVLVYVKAYPLQVLHGISFDLSQSQTNYWLHHLLPVLKRALDHLGVLPERNPQQFARTERRRHESPELIIDGTERRRQRPKNPVKQALHYSGKKKMHSDKNVVIVHAQTKRVGYLSGTYPGKTHDKKVADSETIVYPRETVLDQDTGFQGYAPRVREIRQPKKSRARRS
jgi:hypothetical protein